MNSILCKKTRLQCVYALQAGFAIYKGFNHGSCSLYFVILRNAVTKNLSK